MRYVSLEREAIDHHLKKQEQIYSAVVATIVDYSVSKSRAHLLKHRQ